MHVRITSATGVGELDRAIELVRDHVVPQLQKQHGYRGLSASGDRGAGSLAVVTLWETEADMDASESTADKVRHETMETLGTHGAVERFEQTYANAGATPPGPGSRLQVRRFTIELDRMDENLDYFASTVGPALRSMPGFEGVRRFVNRHTGAGAVGILWADDASLRAATAATEERRREAADRGIRFEETFVHEMLFLSMG